MDFFCLRYGLIMDPFVQPHRAVSSACIYVATPPLIKRSLPPPPLTRSFAMLYRYFTLLLGLFSGAARSSNLSFALIASFGQYGTNSSGVIPAVDLALAEINSHPSVLQGYRLLYDQAKDSEVSFSTTHSYREGIRPSYNSSLQCRLKRSQL